MCRRPGFPWLAFGVFGLASMLAAQDFQPNPSQKPDDKTWKLIGDKASRLGKNLASLRKQGARDPWLADVEIYYQAVVWITHHNEFFQAESAAWTLEALDR